MASPVADSYNVSSGDIVCGRYIYPSWRSGMTAGTWIAIGTTLASIDPENNPAINPNHPSAAPWHGVGGQQAIFTAWGDLCVDTDRSVVHSPLNGGHNDYAGNEPYKIDLSVDSPAWVMLRNPSGAIGNLITLNDGQEATGLYADGRVRSTHGYNKLAYIPGVGPAVIQLGGCYANSSGGKTKRPILIDPNTGEMTRWGAENPDASAVVDDGGGCYDPSRHALWWKGPGTAKFTWYDIALDQWTSVGSSVAVTGGVGMTYIEGHDCIVWVNPNITNGFGVFDCATGIHYEPAISGAFVGMSLSESSPPQRVTGTNDFALWDNSSDTTIINTLSFSSNPRSDTWQIGQLPVDASNTVTPSARGNGTNGRFFYLPKLDGFGLVNSVNEQIYFYARS